MQLRYLVFSSIVLCAPAWAEQATEVDAYAEGFRAFERGDYAAARRIWTPLAESDDPRAQFGLGLIYEGGLGDTPMDQEEALGWYRRAARQGVPAAQNNLAIMYAEGRGVSQDPTLAVTLWRQAAEAGYGPSQLNLAAALERGVGVERSEREATLWHEKAKAQGLTSVEPGHVDHTDERSPVTAAKEASVQPPSPPPA